MSKSIGCSYETCLAAYNDFLKGTVIKPKVKTPPALVHVETIGGEMPVKLSFAIKVF